MKRLLIALVLLALCATDVSAQKKEVVRRRFFTLGQDRTEIILPKVKGFNCYKADFHVHTIYSDGDVTPRERIREAWYDGLDIIAITDHLGARRYEKYMLKALRKYNPDGEPYPYAHAGKIGKVMVDFDAVYAEADKEAAKYPDLLYIHGTEISRTQSTGSDYNALFVKDIESVFDKDPYKCIRNARAQGALIIHNHPVIKRDKCVMTEFETNAMAEGLFDGIEIVNGNTFYPPIMRRAVDNKLFMVGATDTHHPISGVFKSLGIFRTMTIVLAKENTEKGVKDALKKRRTLAYCGGNIMGEEEWLKPFFEASVTCRLQYEDTKKGTRTYSITNNSSFPYLLRRGQIVRELKGMETIRVVLKRSKNGKWQEPRYHIDNLWLPDDKNPTWTLPVSK
ncbi:MAG: histidinol-phosphatase [Alistipes sp.]|nr:histidinol-phosphatase [Alistipes sp.]